MVHYPALGAVSKESEGLGCFRAQKHLHAGLHRALLQCWLSTGLAFSTRGSLASAGAFSWDAARFDCREPSLCLEILRENPHRRGQLPAAGCSSAPSSLHPSPRGCSISLTKPDLVGEIS